MGRYPIIINIVSTALKYLKHLDEVVEDRPLLRAAIKEDTTMCKSKSWAKRLKNILQLFKCPDFATTGINECINYMKKKMKDEYSKYWFGLIDKNKNEGGKLELYAKIKRSFAMEPYLKQIKEFKLRRAM